MKLNAALAIGCALVGLFIGIFAGYAWHAFTSQLSPGEDRQLPPAAVEVESAATSLLEVTLRSIGSVRAVDHAQMGALVGGVVESVSFSDGQDVAAGDELIRINDSETRQMLAVAVANRNEAQRRFERSVTLEKQGLGTSNDRAALAAELEAANARVATLEAELEDYVVVAPFAGRVGLRGVSKGSTIGVNDIISTVTRLDILRIGTTIPERYLGLVRNGIEVSASTPAFPGKTFVGKVVYVSPTLDTASRTIHIEAEISNEEGILRPGQTLDVSVVIAEKPEAIMVPEEAIVLRGNAASIWVINDGRAMPRTVQLGSVGNGQVEIVKGLTAGEQIVVRGVQKIYFPGMPVNPINQAPPAQPESAPPEGDPPEADLPETADTEAAP